MGKTMTFSEFTNSGNTSENAMLAMAAAEELKKKKNEGEFSHMSEGMIAKCNEMLESMCKEMEDCHSDETDRTAESYAKEAGAKLTEMMESISENAMLAMAAADKLKKTAPPPKPPKKG